MTLHYKALFEQKIDILKTSGNYRRFADIERVAGQYPKAIYRPCNYTQIPVTVWCSNDYLGMSQNAKAIEIFCESAQKYGIGAGGTRNISGTSHEHILLEETIAKLHAKEASLVFSSGYVANQTSLMTLGKIMPDCIFLSDEKNHASIIQGIRHSGCRKLIWRHNDVDHLAQLLQDMPKNTPKVIVLESVYSMDGTIAPLGQVVALASEYQALVYLDEVHAVGLYGSKGAGIAQRDGLADRIDFINGTLGKAYGVIGGYVAGDHVMIDAIRSYGSGFIFTTSLPPAVCAAARTNIEYLMTKDDLRHQHQNRVRKLKSELLRAGIPHLETPSHIIPVIVGDAALCRKMTDMLLYSHNIYVQPLNYPTVPWGTERMRLTPSPFHSDQDIAYLVSALFNVFETLAPEKLVRFSGFLEKIDIPHERQKA